MSDKRVDTVEEDHKPEFLPRRHPYLGECKEPTTKCLKIYTNVRWNISDDKMSKDINA